MISSVITTQGLTKAYPAVRALDGLDMSIPSGVVGLVGANGAGKSTLIKILLGLIPATSGSASVLGLDVAVAGEEIRARVGYSPEHDCLPGDVSATEFVVHMARMSGLPATAARERAADVLRHVGLYEERYRAIGGYSTGMKQKVKLAQALAHDPQLLLLDEPTNGLDPAGRDEMLALVQRIGSDFGINVIVTSHLLGELERISDHLVVIEAGRLTHSGATQDATAASGVVAVEVTEREEDLLGLLTQAGFRVWSSGPQLVDFELVEERQLDHVRDCVAYLGVGLVRMQRRRHHLTEIFRAPAGAAAGAVPAGAAPAGTVPTGAAPTGTSFQEPPR